MIQLSDITVGIIGKFFEYLNIIKCEEIYNTRNSLNDLQLNNFKKLLSILEQSEIYNKAFIHSVVPLTHILKHQKIYAMVNN